MSDENLKWERYRDLSRASRPVNYGDISPRILIPDWKARLETVASRDDETRIVPNKKKQDSIWISGINGIMFSTLIILSITTWLICNLPMSTQNMPGVDMYIARESIKYLVLVPFIFGLGIYYLRDKLNDR